LTLDRAASGAAGGPAITGRRTMPDSGQDLGADLYQLWRAGRDNMPSVAAVFANANRSVSDTHNGMEAAFSRSDHFGGGTYGPVYPAFTALRDELQRILGDTAVNIELTGEALCLAATEYAKTDAGAAAELARLRGTNGDLPPVNIPQVQYP
jgi:hypothetical protein